MGGPRACIMAGRACAGRRAFPNSQSERVLHTPCNTLSEMSTRVRSRRIIAVVGWCYIIPNAASQATKCA